MIDGKKIIILLYQSKIINFSLKQKHSLFKSSIMLSKLKLTVQKLISKLPRIEYMTLLVLYYC